MRNPYKESETVEFKKSTSELKEAVVSIAAILNKHNSGEVYFGIGNDGTVLGQQISAKTLRDVSKTISDHIEPKIYPKIQSVKIERKTCIRVSFEGKEFEGDLFHLIEKAQEYILENIHIGMRVEELRREDVPEIAKEAFREAIINAFCHRDYREYDSVNSAVFKDRVEIRSPGLLYGDLTIEKITSKMVSERRNELIAELFHRVHFIEKWGRGIQLILSKEPDARFEEVGAHFIVTFKRKGAVSEGVEKEGLVENQRKMLELIKVNPSISKKELSSKIGISTTAIDKNISSLKRKGLLKRIGPDKGGYWEVQKQVRL